MKTIVLLFFFFNIFIIIKSIQVLKSNIYEGNPINVLGVEYNYAIGDIELSEDFYYHDSWISCPNYQCSNELNSTISSNCTCDYTEKGNCPKTLGSNCPECLENSFYTCNDDWITLTELDKYSTYSINKTTQFRYKVKGNSCMGFSLKVNSNEGYGTIKAGSSLQDSQVRNTLAQKNVLFNFCPLAYALDGVSEDKSWTMDTYFIEITPLTEIYNFSIILHDIEINNNPFPDKEPCSPDIITINGTTTWIYCRDINRNYISSSTFNKFSINEAGYYYFHSPTLPGLSHISYFISKNQSNILPTINNCDWQVVDEGDNDLILYLEPINETQPLILYVNLAPQSFGTSYFSINNVGKRYLKSISSSSSFQSGYLALRGSSKLVLPNEITYFTPSIYSDQNKISFLPLYPTQLLNPIYPPSKLFIKDALYVSLQVPTFNSFKPNSYQFSFLLSRKSSDQYYKYQDFETIQNSTLIIDSTLFDKNGLPIKLNITFNKDVINYSECKVEEFNTINQLINEIKDKLLVVSDIDKTTSLRYSLDYLQSTDLWMKCKDKFSKYFDSELSLEPIKIKNCPYSPEDSEYANDPCCNIVKAYYQCCNPTSTNITSNKFKSVNRDSVKDQCNSYDCTASVLDEYQKTLSNLDLCTVSDYSLTKIGYSVTKVLRDCKDVISAPFCSNDQDCLNYGKCNFYTGKCTPDFEIVDKLYIKCVLNNIPIGTLFYLTNSTSSNDSTIDQIYNNHLASDCIGSLSIMDRSTYTFLSTIDRTSRCSQNTGCLDSTCLLHQDICLDAYSEFIFLLDSRLDNCTDYGFCKSSSCINCKDKCSSTDSFCGYCNDENQTQCHNLESIKDQSECESQNSICLLSDGTIITGKSEKECTETLGKCSHNNCGDVKCTSIIDGFDSGCFATNLNEAACLANGGNYSKTVRNNICRVSLTKDQCSGIGVFWEDCSGKPFGECVGDVEVDALICTEKYSRDCTKDECESIAGECSDSFYFSPDANPLYPNGLGRCVHNHTFTIKSMTCKFTENDSPEGCFDNDPRYFTKESCEGNEGYKWWTRSINRDQCLSKIGCKTMIDSNIAAETLLPYNFKFNEMDKEACEGCEESFNQYTNKFTWTNAKWIPGVFKKPTWINNQYISNQIKNAFSYQLFYNSIEKAIGYQNSEVYRTESLCRVERVQTSFESLVCSCVDDGYQVFSSNDSGHNSQCFQSSVPSIGQIRVCAGEENEFTFDYGQLKFDDNAINQTCQTFTIAQITKVIYTQSIQESLASNFVSYKKPPKYAILNSKDATIGFIASDGIMIQSQEGINKAILCFKKSRLGEYDNDYPVLDIAIQINNQSLPTPLKLSQELINSTDSDYICSIVNSIPKGEPIYFQIYRTSDSDWNIKEKELFDKETKVMMYILAIFFLLVTIFGLYEIISILILYFKRIIISFQLIQSLVFIVTLFILIRAIYFFLLVSGSLQDKPVLDYILVVLPTFIYFTAFSSLIILWYTIVFLVLKNNTGSGITNQLYKIVITVNGILYLFFICIVLVFQYTSFEPNNDCGSRIFIPNQASKPQKAISLAYAIVQAVLSLIISAAFVYLGRTLYITINSNKKNTKHQRKIFILSAICSVGFLLHCIFVLILVTNISSMIFSFIGLIITEIIPVISILYCFNPNSQNVNSGGSGSKDGVRTRSGKSKVSKSINTSKLSTLSKLEDPPTSSIN